MTMTAKQLATSQVAASIGILYGAGTSTKAVVKRASFCNTTAGSITLLVHLVPPGASVTDGNMLINRVSIGAGETYIASELEGQVVEAAGAIHAEASVASSLTAVISGVEIT
jgi:predicted deacylase